MKVYITATFKEDQNKAEIESLCLLVRQSGFDDFCFIRDIEGYQKIFDDAHELMNRARREIARCDAILITYNGPGHGRMIELGIAYALRKKIIVITEEGIVPKETVRGVADCIISYENLADIVSPLNAYRTAWNAQK